MTHPSTPTGSNGARARPRGAIRTHLGRKRVGSRMRPSRDDTLAFDRLATRVQELFPRSGELAAAAFDQALDSACNGLVTAGEFTAEDAARLRHYVRRDLLQRTDPSVTFRTADITSGGTLTCTGCGWKLRFTRTTVLPPCPQCGETSFRKEA